MILQYLQVSFVYCILIRIELAGISISNPYIYVITDGTKVIAAVGNRVLVYKADNGDLIESLRGHKDIVYSVSFSCDGSRFASGINFHCKP